MRKVRMGLILIGLLVMFSNTLVFGYDEEKYITGQCYTENINAYINGRYIESWNIEGTTYVNINDLSRYGFIVEKCDSMDRIRILPGMPIDNSYGYYKSLARPSYLVYKDSDIISTNPEFNHFAAMKARGELIYSGENMVIKFAKPINKETLTSDTIKVFKDKMDVTDAFDFNYGDTDNTLTIEMKSNMLSYSIFKDDGVFSAKTEDKVETYRLLDESIAKREAKLDIFLLDDIKNIAGDNLKHTYRISTNMYYKQDGTGYKKELVGTYESDKRYNVTFKNTRHHTLLLNDKHLIRIEALGHVSWDAKNRVISLVTDNFIALLDKSPHDMLYDLSTPIYKSSNNEWVKATKPEMRLDNTIYVGPSKHYSHNDYLLSKAIELPGYGDGEIGIEFNMDIDKEYINSDYIKLYNDSGETVYNPELIYDGATKSLKIRLNEKPSRTSFSHTVFDEKDKIINSLVGNRYNVYILGGVKSTSGVVLDQTLRFGANVTWKSELEGMIDNARMHTNSDIKENTTYKHVESYVVGNETLVKTYYSDKYYINNSFNDSYELKKNGIEEESEYLKRTSLSYHEGLISKWIKKVNPAPKEVLEGSNKITLLSDVARELTITFEKEIDEIYLDRNYIRIYQQGEDESEMFDYFYDKDSKILKLIFDPTNQRCFNPERKEAKLPRIFDIYIMKGLPTLDGEKLDSSIRITVALERELLSK